MRSKFAHFPDGIFLHYLQVEFKGLSTSRNGLKVAKAGHKSEGLMGIRVFHREDSAYTG